MEEFRLSGTWSVKRRLVKAFGRVLSSMGYRLTRIMETNPIDLLELSLRNAVARGTQLTFIQIGANDGITGDPLRPFVQKYNWEGAFIEPQPDKCSRLIENYGSRFKLHFLNCAIDYQSGSRALYRFKPDARVPAWASGLASFDRNHLLKFQELSQYFDLIEAVDVKTKTAPEILEECELDRIDLLQIDVEGFDFDVIKMFFSQGVLPSWLNFEHFHLDGDKREACALLLKEKGYRWLEYGRDTLALKDGGLV